MLGECFQARPDGWQEWPPISFQTVFIQFNICVSISYAPFMIIFCIHSHGYFHIINSAEILCHGMGVLMWVRR